MRALRVVARAGAALQVTVGTEAAAHGFDSVAAGMPRWTFDGWIVVPLGVSALLFAIGWVRLRVRSSRRAARWRSRGLLFAAGWAAVATALVSPLHAAGERSFAAHMVEHELLMLLGAPLLVLAEPAVVLLWALPAATRRGIGRSVTRTGLSGLWRRATAPFAATLLQAVALWGWHVPFLFDLALARDGWHVAQHLTFMVTAVLFWTAMLRGRVRRSAGDAHRGVAAFCLFATSLVSGALGALMAFSQSPWYAGYARLPMAPFGLTPAEDQQVAGLLMWIPGGLVHAIVALLLVGRVLRADAAPKEGAPCAG